MAGEADQKLEMIPVEATGTIGQGLMYISRKQLLSASFFKLINQKYTPFYRFTQQPAMPKPFILTGYDGPTDISMIMRTKNKQEDVQIALPAVPLSMVAPEESETNFSMNHEIVLWQGGATMENRRVSHLSYTERKESWIIRRLSRSKPNKSDVFYVHLKTDIQFRSLVAVHAFILVGLLPERRKKEDTHKNPTNLSIHGSPPRKVRGDKLLNRIRVGYYNHTTQEIFRNETPIAKGDPKSTHVGIGNKRKQEAETSNKGGEEAWIVGDEAKQLIFALYDFDPIM